MTDSNSSTTVDRPVYCSNSIGVRFFNDDPIAQNPSLLKAIEEALKINPEAVVKVDNATCFTTDWEKFGYLCHLMYCQVPEDYVVLVAYDGIHPFTGLDQDGEEQLFNGQMVTLHQIAAA